MVKNNILKDRCLLVDYNDVDHASHAEVFLTTEVSPKVKPKTIAMITFLIKDIFS